MALQLRVDQAPQTNGVTEISLLYQNSKWSAWLPCCMRVVHVHQVHHRSWEQSWTVHVGTTRCLFTRMVPLFYTCHASGKCACARAGYRVMGWEPRLTGRGELPGAVMGEQRTERGGCEARADPAARCDTAQRKTATAPAHGRDELPARPRAWACAQERGHARTTINTNDVLERLQAGVTGYPGVVTTVVKNAEGPPVGKPVNIEIKGKEIDVLLDEAEKVKAFIDSVNVPGV